jgi:uncharacterized protein
VASESADDPLALSLATAIRHGQVEDLADSLRGRPDLASLWIVAEDGVWRSPLHIVTDWPGHFPRGPETVRLLVQAGADVDAGVRHCASHAETPLHGAASSDDVEVLDALLDAGADIEADAAVIGGRTAVSDAAAFGQWAAARRLVERGARTTFWESATLGLADRVRAFLSADAPPDAAELTRALWGAAHGGQREVAALLLDLGADPNWVGWDGLTAVDAARRNGFDAVADWLTDHGGLPSAQL